MSSLPCLTDFTASELEEQLAPLGLERFRAKQILQWIYRRRATAFEQMTDLSIETRALLAEKFRLSRTRIADRHASADRTEKLLLALDDGNLVETVLIRDDDRKTVCVSTQVGCPLRCAFCASGLRGLVRNLTAGEIVEQVLHVQRDLPEGDRIDNVVVMGIGEPLLNYANVVRALRILKAPWGMGVGYNRVTLSTVGILDKIPQLIADQVTPNLALSLHAPNDRIRRELVPGLKHRLAEVIRAGIEYRRTTHKTVTFEYVLIDGVNDDKKHALELGKKLAGTRVKVNVIPFNPVPETSWRAPSPERLDRFVKALGSCGVPVTVRRRKGDEISAACGQLRHRAEARDTDPAVMGRPIKIPSSALPGDEP